MSDQLTPKENNTDALPVFSETIKDSLKDYFVTMCTTATKRIDFMHRTEKEDGIPLDECIERNRANNENLVTFSVTYLSGVVVMVAVVCVLSKIK